MYLGNGEMLFDAYAKDKIKKIHAMHPEHNIPVSNMYFFSIDEFETLCELVNEGKTTISEFIRKMIGDDAEPQTRKFDPSLHLKTIAGYKVPSFIRDPLDQVFERLGQILKPENNST